MSNIRNFSIIAHIDHGKSTLADRMLEITKTVEDRKMREQYLDQMPLERERGITIKMQPVRMEWKNYILNLIDTPGHIDFSYEVSRALAAVEGAVLLVDATQGVQAQTISNVELARSLNLKIIPVINKIDLLYARINETTDEIKNILGDTEIFQVSARTGEGVQDLLDKIIEKVPPPNISDEKKARALIFDFDYSLHRGIISHARVFDGEIKKGDRLRLFVSKENFIVGEVGFFKPELKPAERISAGEIGYIVTSIKEARIVRVGDTILDSPQQKPLPGYKEVKPVVFSSLFPERQDDFEELRRSLERLKLSDASLSFEEESSGVLGRGFRCGFLGMLHLEIVVERLKRDFGVSTIVATPTVKYIVKSKKGILEIYSPHKFPEAGEIIEIEEPWLKVEILMPPEKLSSVMKLLREYEAVLGETRKFSESRIGLAVEMPLRELMRDFFDELKSVSQGYASMNYEFLENRRGDLLRLDLFVAEEIVPAFSKIVPRIKVEEEAFRSVEKLYKILPQALFSLKIQAKAGGRILASRTLKALRKDVTGYLYGGDRSRKMKLWKKQKEGKKRLSEEARFTIPAEIFVKMIRK
ncbi:elongation factor 4 [Candidatus Giovannonibacteria bacterium RIFCSPLOWO2_02_FULL_43_11b]|uniref:Elongation factor 4 n=1 Tax=Candidatus Giovannonibacteria bacterium RIFCSPHIGHO2_12_FULL_43_15 TaxID=1798341 RepID=A0A1F5WRT6_9BACT|nr:MAG: elongation factor 4 [Candidatus Giovannonibacteria bacterium RIFCSPHIGHO2_01_FULL_43_100]OGF67115.1 MAG: elongation factor 4 [Candidatus Giovannonibacteria bacterium RIFCSPHIGHO2_02_FULL_43_32]OGF77961.1 MAG: elongation factor 4 [Candidatus Giovannonibacteria bacterium RIFCSPHIGHO2_12_FULL_43_15]OGF79313.1 MAG: elongation factor 4 [Candidatus Giovannonibacteria bacterium RIFCSPLOWO2_01_FULL_43_60]OGF89289.1 MAG: elongation factor 4 [Candidatus Giovannonibacteria bacterium RIFCSPLOWO2_02